MTCYILEKVNNSAWLEHRENVYEDLLEDAFLVDLAVAPLTMDPDF